MSSDTVTQVSRAGTSQAKDRLDAERRTVHPVRDVNREVQVPQVFVEPIGVTIEIDAGETLLSPVTSASVSLPVDCGGAAPAASASCASAPAN